MTQADPDNATQRLASPFAKQVIPVRGTSAQMTQLTALYQNKDPLAQLDNAANDPFWVDRAETPSELKSLLHKSPSPPGDHAGLHSTAHHTLEPVVLGSSSSPPIPKIWKTLSVEGAEGCIDHQRITLCPSSTGRHKTQTSLQIYRPDGFSDHVPVTHLKETTSGSFGVTDLIFAGASLVFPDAFAKSLAASMVKLTASAVAQMLHSKLSYCPCTDDDMWQHESQRRAICDHVAVLFPLAAEKRQETQCQRAKCAFDLLKVALEDLEQAVTVEMLQDYPDAVRAIQCIASSLGRFQQDPADVVGAWAWTTIVEPLCRHAPVTEEARRLSSSDMTPAPGISRAHSGTQPHGLPERLDRVQAKAFDGESTHASCTAECCIKMQAQAKHEDGHADIRLFPFTADGQTLERMNYHVGNSTDSAASPEPAGRTVPDRNSQSPVSIIAISDTEDQSERQCFRRSARATTHTNVDYNQKRHILDQYLEDVSADHTGATRKKQRRSGSSTKGVGRSKSEQQI